MKKIFLSTLVLVFAFASCSSGGMDGGARRNYEPKRDISLDDFDSDYGSPSDDNTSSSGPERISVDYKDQTLKMYSFSDKQSKKLFGTGNEYRGLSICTDITIPADIDLSLCANKNYPVRFYLYTRKKGKDILDSEVYSVVKIPVSFVGRTVRIGLCLPKIPSGFALEACPGVTISNMSVEKRTMGWSISDGILKYSFGPSGGTLYTNLSEVNFSDGKKTFGPDIDTEIQILYDSDGDMLSQRRYDMSIGEEKFRVRYNSEQDSTRLSCGAFENPFSLVSLETLDNVTGIVMMDSMLEKNEPIVSDPGLIVDWDMKRWRNKDYEVFLWEEFPNVLIFDTANYRVQDKFFKRLAFFAEKEGYIGTIATDKMIEDQHGFNALDYRASVVADFFNRATKQKFSLNAYELTLKKIMIQNGLFVEKEGGLVSAVGGALVSISRELPDYLRWQFINHECFHGIYFTQEDFRDEVSLVYDAMDLGSKEFVKAYFALTPNLSYDISDVDLVQNEIMAYTLQYSLDNVGKYYTRIASQPLMREKVENLCEYIEKTGASGFVKVATALDTFVNREYGLNSGRVYLISRRGRLERESPNVDESFNIIAH